MHSDYLYFDLETNVSKIWSYGKGRIFKNIWILHQLVAQAHDDPSSWAGLWTRHHGNVQVQRRLSHSKKIFAIYITATRTRTRTVKYHTMSSSSWSPLSRWTSSNSPILLIETLGSDGDQYFFLFPLFDNQRRVVSQKKTKPSLDVGTLTAINRKTLWVVNISLFLNFSWCSDSISALIGFMTVNFIVFFYADFLKLPTIDLVTVDLSSWCRTKWICLMRMGMLRDSASVCLLCFAFF